MNTINTAFFTISALFILITELFIGCDNNSIGNGTSKAILTENDFIKKPVFVR